MNEKKRLAFEVVKLLWGEEKADKAQKNFEQTFQEKKPEYITHIEKGSTLEKTIARISTIGSLSAAKRLITQKAVDVDGQVIIDPNFEIKGGEKIKVGKKIFVKVKE